MALMLAWLNSIKAYLIAAAVAVGVVGLVVWRIFAAGARSGKQEAEREIAKGVERVKKEMREAQKPKGEDDATDRMDSGRF